MGRRPGGGIFERRRGPPAYAAHGAADGAPQLAAVAAVRMLGAVVVADAVDARHPAGALRPVGLVEARYEAVGGGPVSPG